MFHLCISKETGAYMRSEQVLMDSPLRLWLKNLLGAWSIQQLILAGLVFQFILAIFGSRRRFMTGFKIRFIVWASYLPSASVAMTALGKSTAICSSTPKKHCSDPKNTIMTPS